MAIKLEALRVFRAVAEAGNLAGAGEALGRTPSALSMTLAQLEAEVGAALFETDRKSRLTPLGRRVLEESARATDAFGRSLDAIRRHAASLAGTVRVAAVPSATATLLPGVVATYRAARPGVRLEISDADSAEVRRRVDDDEADIGIVSAGAGEPGDGVAILSDELGLVFRARGPVARRARSRESWRLVRLEPLVANPLCALVPHPAVAEALAASSLEARNTTALLAFVRAGLGCTILPRSTLAAAPRGLGFIAPDDPPARRELRKIARPDRRFSPAVEAFWAAL